MAELLDLDKIQDTADRDHDLRVIGWKTCIDTLIAEVRRLRAAVRRLHRIEEILIRATQEDLEGICGEHARNVLAAASTAKGD